MRKRHKLNEEIKQVYRNKPLHERLGLNLKINPNEKILTTHLTLREDQIKKIKKIEN